MPRENGLPAAPDALGGRLVEQVDHLPEPVLVGPVHAGVLAEELQVFGGGLHGGRLAHQVLGGELRDRGVARSSAT